MGVRRELNEPLLRGEERGLVHTCTRTPSGTQTGRYQVSLTYLSGVLHWRVVGLGAAWKTETRFFIGLWRIRLVGREAELLKRVRSQDWSLETRGNLFLS